MILIPFFSVIIPTYNSEKFIEKTLESILHQTFRSFELIVVDDGSQDRTAIIAETFIKRNEMRGTCIRQKNQKIAAARNTGIRAATGSWIALCDHDDRWNAQKLKKVADKIQELPDVNFIVHEAEAIYENNARPSQKILLPRGQMNLYEHLLFRGNPIATSAVVFKKPDSEFGKMFAEDLELFTVEDLDYWIHLAETSKYAFIHEQLAQIHWHDRNASADRIMHNNNYLFMIKRHLNKLQKNKSILKKARVWTRVAQIASMTFFIKLKHFLKNKSKK